MVVVRFIVRFWNALLGKDSRTPMGIDSHKWESKMETFNSLSNKHH